MLLDRTDRFDEKLWPRCGAADGRVNCILQELVLLMIDVLEVLTCNSFTVIVLAAQQRV